MKYLLILAAMMLTGCSYTTRQHVRPIIIEQHPIIQQNIIIRRHDDTSDLKELHKRLDTVKDRLNNAEKPN